MGNSVSESGSSLTLQLEINTRQYLFDRLAPDRNQSHRLLKIRYCEDATGLFRTFHHLLIQKLDNGGLQVDVCDLVDDQIKLVLQTSLTLTWQPNSSKLILTYPRDDWVCVLQLELKNQVIQGTLQWHAPGKLAYETHVILL